MDKSSPASEFPPLHEVTDAPSFGEQEYGSKPWTSGPSAPLPTDENGDFGAEAAQVSLSHPDSRGSSPLRAAEASPFPADASYESLRGSLPPGPVSLPRKNSSGSESRSVLTEDISQLEDFIPEDLPKSAIVEVKVVSPEKRGENISSYVVYHVKTIRMDRAENKAVERRYNDFVWLRNRLRKQCRGIIVPPLPDKGTIKAVFGRFGVDFIKKRQRALERFLTQIVEHEKLRTSAPLQIFLCAEQSTLKLAIESPQRKRKTFTTKSQEWGRYLRESWTQCSTSLGLRKASEPSEDDLKCAKIRLENKRTVETLHEVATSFRALSKSGTYSGVSLFDVGVASKNFAQSEASANNEALSNVWAKFAQTVEVISNKEKRKAQEEQLVFAEPMHEYYTTGKAIGGTLRDRKSAGLTYETEVNRLESRRAKLLEAEQKKENMESKLADYQSGVQEAEDSRDRAKVVLDEITNRVFDEVDRFNKRKSEDMDFLLREFVKRQIQHAKDLEREWVKLQDQLERESK